MTPYARRVSNSSRRQINMQISLPGNAETWQKSPLDIQSSSYLQSLGLSISKSTARPRYSGDSSLSCCTIKPGKTPVVSWSKAALKRGSLSPDAWHALQKCINGGKPSRIASHAILRECSKPAHENYMVLVSPLFEKSSDVADGVICQMIRNQTDSSGDCHSDGRSEGYCFKSVDVRKTNPKMDFLGLTKHNDVAIDEHPFFHRFAEMLPTGVAILDHNAQAVFVNQQFYRLTTHWADDKSFRSWPQSIHPNDYERVTGAYREAFDSQKQLRTEFRALGSAHPWRLLILMPLGDENLRHVSLETYGGSICSVVDINSGKSAENDQREAAEDAFERKRQQEQFIDMISHEIRNPLSAIVHCLEDINEALQEKRMAAKSTSNRSPKRWRLSTSASRIRKRYWTTCSLSLSWTRRYSVLHPQHVNQSKSCAAPSRCSMQTFGSTTSNLSTESLLRTKKWELIGPWRTSRV